MVNCGSVYYQIHLCISSSNDIKSSLVDKTREFFYFKNKVDGKAAS